ncbi:MAG: zinc ribbon domain-containing protein [Spirochaetes bacterium]|nr:zinc ribbon domain-containing protein [Spirochaetota bacterium]
MQCTKCKKELEIGSKFCNECGAKVQTSRLCRCLSCNAEIEVWPDTNYCPECGNKVEAAPVEEASPLSAKTKKPAAKSQPKEKPAAGKKAPAKKSAAKPAKKTTVKESAPAKKPAKKAVEKKPTPRRPSMISNKIRRASTREVLPGIDIFPKFPVIDDAKIQHSLLSGKKYDSYLVDYNADMDYLIYDNNDEIFVSVKNPDFEVLRMMVKYENYERKREGLELYDFDEIESLFNECLKEIKNNKKRS